MIHFQNDYSEGTHPRILQRLLETNELQTAGYGLDEFSARARQLIQTACEAPDAAVHFLTGGTQTNLVVIAAILRPHQGVIAPITGHIGKSEAGAIEATGHKVLTLPTMDGKLTAAQVEELVEAHWSSPSHEHAVQPGMVYISQPTETGTLYSKQELQALRTVCDEQGLPLFIDGARLGYGLVAEMNDVTLPDIAALSDVFYIGGTKIGAMFGEAVVITKESLKRDFRYLFKQRGAMLAKGRMLGIQFEVLFENNLYTDIAQHAVTQSMKIRQAALQLGCALKYDSMTNQQFLILPNEWIAKLHEKYNFFIWSKESDTHSVGRFCTSWCTKPEYVDAFIADLQALALQSVQ